MTDNTDISMKNRTTLHISALTYPQIEEKISQTPALIIPVGGMEPVGKYGAMGIVNTVTERISIAVSEKCSVLCSPLLSYGHTTPYQAFGGSVGIKRNILESLISGFIKECSLWGIKYFFIINGTYKTHGLFEDVARRFCKNAKNTIFISIFTWQEDSRIRKFIKNYFCGEELGRSEFGLLSMAAFLAPELVPSMRQSNTSCRLPEKSVYQRWMKRGKDPEKFRKLFPHSTTSGISSTIDSKTGKSIFEYIVQYCCTLINTKLNTGD